MTTESTNDDQLKRLIQIRRGNRSVVTKLENEVSSIISRISASEASSNSATKANLLARVESISTSLKQKHQYITELNEQIINKIDTPLIDKEIDETSEWDATVFEVINKIEQIKLGSYTRDPQPPGIPIGQIESNTQQEEQDRSFSSSFDSSEKVASVTALANDKKQVLLQTAKAQAFAADGVTKIPITILFDSGSQRSYISEETKKKLSLPENEISADETCRAEKVIVKSFQNPPTQLPLQPAAQSPSQQRTQLPMQANTRPRRRAAVLGETVRRQIMH
eukprot:gene4041-20216_t